MEYLTMIIVAIVVLAVAKFLLNFNFKRIIELIINTILGIIVLWLINKFGGSYGIYIPINFVTAIIVGVLGLPGVVLLLILCYFKII